MSFPLQSNLMAFILCLSKVTMFVLSLECNDQEGGGV